MSRPPGTIAFLGFGLIGGSIARALASSASASRGLDRPRLVAWSPTGRGPALAVAEGVIDLAASSPSDALAGADLVVIAAPPLETIDLVHRIGGDLAEFVLPGAVVTDVASTKTAILEAASGAGIRYVGGHPMAGRETTGYESAADDLFVDRPWVIVAPDGAPQDAVELVTWLATKCQARPLPMSAQAHDAATAAISHLPLVVAAALVECIGAGDEPFREAARTLAATGWASATRLALGDPRMGAGIVATNAPEVAAGIRALRDMLDGWLALLEGDAGPDTGALIERFAKARSQLTAMAGPRD